LTIKNEFGKDYWQRLNYFYISYKIRNYLAINNWNKQNIQIDESKINKNTAKNDYRLIIDKPAKNVSDFKEHSDRLSQIIVKSIPQFTVGIFGGWGTGKTTMMQMIKDEIDTNYSNIATTIWFDSWRYEREEYSLMIPLLRTIIVTLHNLIIQLTDDRKKRILQKAQSAFIKVIKAVTRGTKVNLGAEAGGDIAEKITGKVSAGLSLDFAEILDEYESSGHINYDQKRISLHKHVSEYLKEELDNIKGKYRLVIFIDDLDRCTPASALEILESIKTFFDIEGIIYVIGMDPSTIDPIIHVKYGESSRISGLDYLQKIVQLPFQIPMWTDYDLGKTITEMAKETGRPKDVTEKLSGEKMIDLIIKSAKLNPRNIKRFINSIVLSYNTTDKNIKDITNKNLRNYIIENYLESMISVQTFYFRGEKWLQFLKMINNYTDRVDLLSHFIVFAVNKKISLQELQDKIKDFSSQEYRKADKKTLEIYNELIEVNDEDFLISY
jgi:predicted KAP-like P-loop ATPase